MNVQAATGLIEQVNEQLDPVALLEQIGFAADKIQVVGASVKAFCPIHKDTRFRSLLIDAKKKTFKCTTKTCAGYQGGSLVELYAYVREIPPLAAATELVRLFQLEIDTSQLDQVALSFLDEAERAFVDYDHAKAEAAAREAIKFRPDLLEARLLLANILAAKGESAQACDEFIAVAENYLGQSKYEDADRVLERASMDFPENEDLLLLKVHSAELQGNRERAETLLLELASRREASGRQAENVGVYEKLSSLFPDKFEYLEKLAEIHLARREFDRAISTLNNLAFHYAKQGQHADVVRVVEKAAAIRRPEAGVQSVYVDSLVALGKREQARAALHELVLLYIENTMFFEAQQAARRWLDVEPDSPEVHEWLGLIWQEQANGPEAAREFWEAAHLARQRGELERAIELLGQARFNEPESVELRWDLIAFLRQAEQFDQAFEELCSLADFLFALGDKEGGERAVLQALEIRPLTATRLELAPLLAKHGCAQSAARLYLEAAQECDDIDDTAGAVACYQSYLELNPADTQAKLRYAELLWESDLTRLATQVSLELLNEAQREDRDKFAQRLLPRIAAHPPEDPILLRNFLEIALATTSLTSVRSLAKALAAVWPQEDAAPMAELLSKSVAALPDDVELLEESAVWYQRAGNRAELLATHLRVADLAEQSGNLRKALAHLAMALEIEPEREDVIKRRANILERLDDPELARAAHRDYLALLEKRGNHAELVEEFRRYLEKWPDELEIRRKLVVALEQLGRTSDALAELRVILQAARQQADLPQQRGILEQMIRLSPDDPDLRLGLADVLILLGEKDEALHLYEEIATRALDEDDPELAEKAFARALEFQPREERLLRIGVRIAHRRGDLERIEQLALQLAQLGQLDILISFYREQVAAALSEGKVDSAEHYAAKWLELEPQSQEALEAAAVVAERRGDAQAAVHYLQVLADYYAATGAPEAALEKLVRAENLAPEEIAIKEKLLKLLLANGRAEQAAEVASRMVDLARARGDEDQALLWLDQLAQIRPEDFQILRERAETTYRTRGAQAALPLYEQLLEAYKRTGKAEATVELYKELLQCYPNEVSLREEFADFLEKEGFQAEAKQMFVEVARHYRDTLNEPLRAIPLFGRATSLAPSPDDAELFEELAELYFRTKQIDFAAGSWRDTARLYEVAGHWDRALVAQKQVCELAVADVFDWEKLGQLYEKTNQPREALSAYKKAYEYAEHSSAIKTDQRIALCERILAFEPQETEFLIKLLEMLPADVAAKRALDWLAQHGAPLGLNERIRILETTKRLAQKNLEVRQALAAIWREQADRQKLSAELIGICEIATGKNANKIRKEAIDELKSLPRSPELSLKLAELMANTGDTEHAVECYTQVADDLIAVGEWRTALQALESAMALDPAALAAPLIAKLYRASGGDIAVHDLAKRALDAALVARSRTRVLVLGKVLLEFAAMDAAFELLESVNHRAGAAFLVALAGIYLDWLIEQGRVQDARLVLEKILSLAGSAPDSWYLAAQIHRKLGDGAKAAQASLQAARLFAQAGAVTEEENCYREVLEVFPEDIPTLETLVSFYERERRKPDVIDLVKRLVDLTLAKNDPAAAAKWIKKYLQYDPGNIELREKLAEQLIKAGNGEEAVKALFELAKMLQTLKFTDRAIAIYERISVVDPDNEQALQALLELAEQLKDLGRALKCAIQIAQTKKDQHGPLAAAEFLKSFAERHPDYEPAWEKFLAMAQLTGDERLQVHALRTLGYQAAKNSDFARAVEVFDKLVALRPDDKEALKMLLDCCASVKLTKKAADVAQRLFEIELEEGNPARIREAALTVLAFDDKRAHVRKRLAATLAELGQLDEAVRQWWLASEVFVAEKKYTEAIGCVEAITRAAPSHLDAWKRLADLSALIGNEDVARDALVHLANALVDHGEPEQACRVLEKVLEHGEPDPAIRERALEVYRRCGIPAEILPEIVWLVHYYLNRRNLPKAEELVREGLEIDPEDLTLLECRVEIARRLGKTEEVLFRLRDLAERYIQLGDKHKAAAMLAELVAEDPTLLDVRLQLAKLYEELEQLPRAQEEYAEIVRAKLEQGEIEEAREVAEKALAGTCAGTEFRARLAELFAAYRATEIAGRLFMQCAKEAEAHEHYDRAIHFLQRASEIRPKWIEAYEALAELCTKANRQVEALAALERLSELLLDQKRLREAVGVLKRRIQLAPKEIEPRRQLIELLEVLGEREARMQQLQEFADLLVMRGEVEEAVEVYHQLTLLEPDDPTLLSRYLELFAQIGNELEVLPEYQRLADLYIKKGQFQEATRTFERIISIDRRQREVRERFIQFLQSAGQRSRAIAEMVKLADLCMSTGHYADAVRWLGNANALNPSDLNVLESLAEAYARASNPDAAAEHFYKLARACRETDPWRAVAACRRTVELVPHHRPTREIFSDLLMTVRERAEAAANALVLAELYRSSGEMERAREQENLAKQYEPETIESLSAKLEAAHLEPAKRYEYLVRLGDLVYQAGDVDRAIECYRKAREIDNSSPELIRKYVNALLQIAPEHEAIADLIELARSYEGRGAALRALETYEMVLKIDAKNPVAKAGRTRMRKITNTE
ncbi:MAG: tetratricopeptide repeat protein [Candidatus Sumerlaeaceae bacterium]